MKPSKTQPEGPAMRQASIGASEKITIHVQPTTGGQYDVEISPNDTADELRRIISRRLQTPKERLKILFRERVLQSKPLKDYKICDGSRVTLLPSVESGFSSTVQGTQQSIIQAIEGLSDAQIDDFLSGCLPLTLALRVGDHMMFVQLQLERPQPGHEQRIPRTHHVSPPSLAQSTTRPLPPRLFTDVESSLASTTAGPLKTAESELKESPRTRTVTDPLTGPAPKVPKLSADSVAADRREPVPALPHFPPQGVPFAMFDPRQGTHRYSQSSPCVGDRLHVGANHLRKLVSACSSLEQVVTIPPTAALNTPATEPLRKSPRKRPSELSPLGSPPRNGPPYFPTPLIQSALMRRHQQSGLPPLSTTSLLNSAYARYQASSGAPPGSSQSAPTSPTSPSAEIRRKHPITTNMLQAGNRQHGSRSERHHHRHHRRASSSGRLSSGSFSHHTPAPSGHRVVRQMQRLRRLCGSHQQCVAYSSRELASEISSIVHMARHHARGDASSHRKGRKSCRECHSHDKASGSASGSSTPASGIKATGACIDSFTTHGPGIFSGTFSGSLHPSIQDSNGKPKRDPKTILKILTDLLSATQLHQGQHGTAGHFPQLLKDHFKSEPTVEKESGSSTGDKTNAMVEKAKISSQQNAGAIRPRQEHGQSSSDPVYPTLPFSASRSGQKASFPAQYLSSVSTIPIGRLPTVYAAPRHANPRGSRRNSPSLDPSAKQHRRHHHCVKHSGGRCCSSAGCRRHGKHQMAVTSYVKREYENEKTRGKMRELAMKMEQRRRRRQSRRTAAKICAEESVVAAAEPPEESPRMASSDAAESRIVHSSEVKSGSMGECVSDCVQAR